MYVKKTIMTHNLCISDSLYDDTSCITNCDAPKENSCTYGCFLSGRQTGTCTRSKYKNSFCLTHHKVSLDNKIKEAIQYMVVVIIKYQRLHISCNIMKSKCLYQDLISGLSIDYRQILRYYYKMHRFFISLKFAHDTKNWSHKSDNLMLNQKELKDFITNYLRCTKVTTYATKAKNNAYPMINQELAKIKLFCTDINKLYKIEEVNEYVHNIMLIINACLDEQLSGNVMEWLENGRAWTENVADNVITLIDVLKKEAVMYAK